MNNLLSPLIILHIVVIAISYLLKPFGVRMPTIPLFTKQYVAWPIAILCSLLLISSTTLVFSKAWEMGKPQRAFIMQQVSPKNAEAAEIPHGSVAITFDDGWLSQQNAIPILQKHNQKATFYIITTFMLNAQEKSKQSPIARAWEFFKVYIIHVQKADERRYMSVDEVKAVQAAGHEIGAHTRTHPDLPSVSPDTAYKEIRGSKEDLASVGIVTTDFAYPSGDYNSMDQALVEQAGFSSAKTADDGYNSSTTPKYALQDQLVDDTTTFADVKGWIDHARANNVSLVLTFHQVDKSGDTYSVTPELFSQICDYLQSSHANVVTMQELMQTL